MNGTVYTSSPLEAPRFGHAWRDDDGNPYAAVYLSGVADVTFASAAEARELAAVILTAADAIDALPPAPEGEAS